MVIDIYLLPCKDTAYGTIWYIIGSDQAVDEPDAVESSAESEGGRKEADGL